MNKLNINTLYSSRLHEIIPGGAHTYSRGDDQFPSNAPSILEKGKIDAETIANETLARVHKALGFTL